MQRLEKLDSKLSAKEEDLIKTFRTLLTIDQKVQWTTDDFRKYGLDRFLEDPQHDLGVLLFKVLRNKKARKVGRTRSTLASNHLREIRVYEWIQQ